MKYLFFALFLIQFFSCKSSQLMPSEPFQNIRLHDIWALSEMNSLPINRDWTPQVPYVEIHVQQKKIYGTDGCNEFAGNITTLNNTQIEFGDLVGTEKGCLKMKISNEFRLLIKQVSSYRLEGLQLVLLNKEKKELLQFKKVD